MLDVVPVSPLVATVRAQYTERGQDRYACSVVELRPGVIVVTVCDPSERLCESVRITNDAVMAFIRWHLDTVADLSRRGGA